MKANYKSEKYELIKESCVANFFIDFILMQLCVYSLIVEIFQFLKFSGESFLDEKYINFFMKSVAKRTMLKLL